MAAFLSHSLLIEPLCEVAQFSVPARRKGIILGPASVSSAALPAQGPGHDVDVQFRDCLKSGDRHVLLLLLYPPLCTIPDDPGGSGCGHC